MIFYLITVMIKTHSVENHTLDVLEAQFWLDENEIMDDDGVPCKAKLFEIAETRYLSDDTCNIMLIRIV